MTRLVDLSQDIYQGMQVYPGHLKTLVFQHATHEETRPRFESGFSFQTMGIMLNDNGPTHVDSFSHLDPDPEAPTIDQMPLELFHGDAICLDVSHIQPHTDIEAEDLDEALERPGLEVREGDIVLLYTGTFNRCHGTADYLTRFPGLGESGSRWMVENGVKAFGVDSPTPDNPISRTYPCHMMSRQHRITHYENLANLDQVAGRRFHFIGFPLKIKGGHGGPTRAVALFED
ncbi:MAG: cyclase family protein [Acidimicrobiia bacterium]